MEKLILDMMKWIGVTVSELEEQKLIKTTFGKDLSWEYLSWVRNNPISWRVPTSILFGSLDHLQSLETITSFAEKNGFDLTIFENGEHWFHTEEQMKFLDDWIVGLL